MGVVYRAYDPELRRHVALKVLRAASDPAQEERLRREARGLARQQHPSVVQVLGLGHDNGRTWIAMELVPGVTLARWCAEHPAGPPERTKTALRFLRAVAEALAAAHAVGLVHRDVKPANVLVREDGVVKLADFGLVRLEGSRTMATREDTSGIAVGSEASLSRTGAIVGTPRYMSPEQLEGRPADARSDQFSFGVSAWEVLCGVPPFAGKDVLEILDAIVARRLDTPPRAALPPGVRNVLRRAMAPAPEERFVSMDALLVAWTRAMRPRARVAWVVGASALAAVAAVLPGLVRTDVARCDGRAAQQAFSELFDAQRRQTISRALTERGRGWSARTESALAESLAEYGRRWGEAETQACAAARAGAAQDVKARDRLLACRRDALETTDALLARFEAPSAPLAERMLTAVGELPDPSACGTRDDETESTRATALRKRLARAEADRIAGHYAEAAVAARQVADDARTAELDRIRSEALLLLGRVSSNLGAPSTLGVLEEAYTLAMALDDAGLAFPPAVTAVVWQCSRNDPAGARAWLRHAAVAAARLPPSAVTDVELDRAECAVLHAEGRLADALARCRTALEVLDESGASHPTLRDWLRGEMETLLRLLGRTEEALAIAVELRDQAEAQLGPDHPTTAGRTMNVGVAAKAAGDLTTAEESFRRAEAVFVATYGDTHRWVVSALLNLASVHEADHDYAGSETVLLEALAATAGREDAAAARVLHNLAETRRNLGRPEEALEMLERVESIEAAELLPGHLQTAFTHHTRGNIYLDLGRLDDAERELLTARAIWDRSGRFEHTQLEEAFARLARLRREREAAGAVDAGDAPR